MSKIENGDCPEFFLYLRSSLGTLSEQLQAHPIYAEVNSIERLRVFMREHVFAVWDFMSLLKRLQREFCGITLPWLPPVHADLARFVNDIVLAEETDQNMTGHSKFASHFELYLSAMSEIQADTKPIQQLLLELNAGTLLTESVDDLNINPETKEFVKYNIHLAQQGTTAEVASAFCYGREDVIPEMFSRLIATLAHKEVKTEQFQYYLDRHVELDGDSHGPLARKMVSVLASDEESRAQIVTAAKKAIEMRIKLWDGIVSRF